MTTPSRGTADSVVFHDVKPSSFDQYVYLIVLLVWSFRSRSKESRYHNWREGNGWMRVRAQCDKTNRSVSSLLFLLINVLCLMPVCWNTFGNHTSALELSSCKGSMWSIEHLPQCYAWSFEFPLDAIVRPSRDPTVSTLRIRLQLFLYRCFRSSWSLLHCHCLCCCCCCCTQQ